MADNGDREGDPSNPPANSSSLAHLGVNVFDQQELEAGIMRQLDEEASRQASEQERRFAEKELRAVQDSIRQTKVDVASLSRQINSLLLKPLPDVILNVKELKKSREEKNLKLEAFQQREKELKETLATGNFSQLQPFQADRLFDLPASNSDQLDQLKLIRSGLMTPFGASSSSTVDKQVSQASHVTKKDTSPNSSVCLAEFDWLGIKANKGKGKGPAKTKKGLKITTEDSSSSCSNAIVNDLENESRLLATKNCDSLELQSETSSSWNWSEDVTKREHETDSESYVTDDELGGAKKGTKRRRQIESEESDDDLIQVNWTKRKSVTSKGRRRTTETTDDGNEDAYKRRMRQYRATLDGSEEVSVDVEHGFKAPRNIWQKLYRYQQTGVRWLWELHCQQAGGIMGDEMGLGKTIEMIAFLAGLKISNVRSHVTRELGVGPILIVCPATVLRQWVGEFHTWYPPFRVAILHDTGSYEGSKSSLLNRIVSANGVIITTYANLRIHNLLLLKHQWEYVILDEGHKIRNPDAEITLACKQFATPHRIILSGSPMQNNLRELWSLFDFVFPGKLGTLPVFMEQFSVPITLGGYINASKIQVETAYRCACILRDTINPYLLRRLKSDVKLQLPNKNEQVLFCRLTDYQKELYEEYIKGSEVQAMMAGGKLVFAGLMTLRKLCNHPDLVTKEYQTEKTNNSYSDEENSGDEQTTLLSITKRVKREEEGEGERDDEEESYGFWRRSGKMIVVEALLKMWHQQKHKVLLFSQSRQMLNIMQKFLLSHGYSFRRMDGTTSIAQRQLLIKDFNEDPSIYVFLLTTRVGGLGVNLTGADRVIIYDPDWNPSTDTQARERAWRIGQTRPVTIYRLLTSGTIEEKVYHRQIFKQFLTNRVLRDPRQRRFFKSNDLYELFTLGSSDGPHKTETSAIIAGTGSEIKMPKKAKTRTTGTAEKTPRRVSSSSAKKDSLPTSSLPSTSTTGDASSSTVTDETSRCTSGENKSAATETATVDNSAAAVGQEENEQLDQASVEMLLSCQRRKKKKKKRTKKKQREMEVEGHSISGLANIDTFNPGSEDEECMTSNRQDNLILRKLFKRSGVHTAIQHDTLIDGGDPDSIIVESEANRVAQSAARALKDSYRQCRGDSGVQWGQPTWTGQHGSIGAPRFGEASKETKVKKTHFAGIGESNGGSLTLSSNVLLSKMRSRNALTLPEAGQRHLHSSDNQDLLRELRSFIATQAKRPGKATTDEILKKFSQRLSPSQSPVFRSLLHEICDFQRYHGDGLWTLKSDYR